ncbi:tafazzin-like [Mya arenaria]|uniref:tafazzin-like n=1 Tax=Mya arenaria TaxID=6604 RepID=UPI0022DEF2BD|nr:tafazzin-like [Mya arenaria]
MNVMLQKLNEGKLVHIFPEGKVNTTKEHMRLKWGVGRLVAEADNTPVVLPLFHLGLDSILPLEKPRIPRMGKDVTIVIGEPLDYADFVSRLKTQNKSPMEIRKAVTDDIQVKLRQLRAKAEKLHSLRIKQDQAFNTNSRAMTSHEDSDKDLNVCNNNEPQKCDENQKLNLRKCIFE